VAQDGVSEKTWRGWFSEPDSASDTRDEAMVFDQQPASRERVSQRSTGSGNGLEDPIG